MVYIPTAELNDAKTRYNLKWQILTRAKVYNIGAKQCCLCLQLKMYILNTQNGQKKSEKAFKLQTCLKISFILQNVKHHHGNAYKTLIKKTSNLLYNAKVVSIYFTVNHFRDL